MADLVAEFFTNDDITCSGPVAFTWDMMWKDGNPAGDFLSHNQCIYDAHYWSSAFSYRCDEDQADVMSWSSYTDCSNPFAIATYNLVSGTNHTTCQNWDAQALVGESMYELPPTPPGYWTKNFRLRCRVTQPPSAPSAPSTPPPSSSPTGPVPSSPTGPAPTTTPTSNVPSSSPPSTPTSGAPEQSVYGLLLLSSLLLILSNSY